MVITKRHIRQHLRQLRRSWALTQVPEEYCELLAAQLKSLVPPYSTIAGYWPQGSELDCRPLLNHLHQCGYKLCLPRTINETKILIFHAWQPGDLLRQDGAGVLAPLPTASLLQPEIILTPLLGFDRLGNRLGQGKGYYDATLSELKCPAIGLAFECQYVELVPVEDTDVPLDNVLTPTKLYSCKKDRCDF